MQGPGNGGGRQRQAIHLGPQGLEALLVGDAEAVFLVDDDQTQFPELDILLQQPMGPDDDVHFPFGQFPEGLFLFRAAI